MQTPRAAGVIGISVIQMIRNTYQDEIVRTSLDRVQTLISSSIGTTATTHVIEFSELTDSSTHCEYDILVYNSQINLFASEEYTGITLPL
jgi:hypothetical protein